MYYHDYFFNLVHHTSIIQSFGIEIEIEMINKENHPSLTLSKYIKFKSKRIIEKQTLT